jgi:hypothetical protein
VPYTVAAKNLMLNALASVLTYAALHTGAPGSTGANELTGGTPAYARKPIAWNTAAAGNLDDTAPTVFDVAGGTTIRFLGFWSAISAGTFYGSAALGAGAPKMFTATTADVLTSVAHGLVTGDTVVVIDTSGNLPTGLAEETIYYVRDETTDTLKLAATAGGVAIDLTVAGVGYLTKCAPVTYLTQGTYTVDDADTNLNL